MSTKETSKEPHEAQRQKSDNSERSVAEWTTLGISSAILLGIISMVLWFAFTQSDQPPIISVEPLLTEIRHDETGYYVPVVIQNHGDETVADAMIEGELIIQGQESETSEITIGFLAAGEEEHGTLVFQNDPEDGDFTVSIRSFKKP